MGVLAPILLAALLTSACGGIVSPDPSDASPGEAGGSCVSCINGCRPQLDACMADPSCMAVVTCVNGCNGAFACVQDCQAKHPSATFDAFTKCVTSCADDCT